MNRGELLHSPSSVVFCIQYPSMISSVRFSGVGVAVGFDGDGRADVRSSVSVGSRVWKLVLVGMGDGAAVFVGATAVATTGVSNGGAGGVHATELTATKTKGTIRRLIVFMPSVYNGFA
jgi:hypothetical protein